MKTLLLFLLFLPVTATFAQEIGHIHSPFYALTENKGQWAEQVLFQSRSQGQNIWVQQHGFIYDLRDYSSLRHAHDHPGSGAADSTYRGTIVAAHFKGSQRITNIDKKKQVDYYYNYFIGNDSTKWASDVRSYQEITLSEFYSNIDLKVFDHESQFKYELWCRPESDPSQIAIEFKGAKGVSIDKKGNLVIATELGDFIEKAPVAYQLLSGKLTPVSCKFLLNGRTVSFELGNFNRNATLIIDPVLVFATYSGSRTDNFGMTATYGYDGTAYSAGTIFGNAYPTPDPAAYDVTSSFSGVYAGLTNTDVFLSKYSADGTSMLWTSFLGGNTVTGTETAHSLICDKQNNIYVFGVTSSTTFPVQNAYQSTHGGGSLINVANNGANFGSAGTDIFVSKLSANGHTLMGSTYIGGSANDGVNYKTSSGNYSTVASYDSLTTNYGDQFRGEIMIDSMGNCIVASCTRSANFPTLNAFQNTIGGKQDGVIFKLSSNLSTLQWSSFYGGSNNDACYSVKIDSSYNIVFAGGTSSNNLPGTAGSFTPLYQGGISDGFVGKLTPNGQTLVRASYIGQSSYDQAMFVEINRNDEIFVYGQSRGGTFPIVNATGNAASGQFIIKLTPDLSTLLNSTTFGNGNSNYNISPSAFLVDICGNMYISGWGGNILDGSNPLGGMPISSDALISTPPNGFDFYLAVFDRDFDGLLYGSYLGGGFADEHVDGGTSRFDKNGVVYHSVCGGCGGNSDFPTTPGAWSMVNMNTIANGGGNNNCNNIVFKFDFQLIPKAEFQTDDLIGCADFEVTLQNSSTPSDAYLWDFGNGQTSSTIFNPTVTYTIPGQYLVTLAVTDSICLLTDTAKIYITVTPPLQLSVSNDTTLCSPLPLTFTANSFGTADTFIWSTNNQFTDTLNASVADSVLTITPGATTTYYVHVSNPGCSRTDSVTAFFIGGSLVLSGNDSICLGEQTTITANIDVPGITFDYSWSPASVITPTAQDNVVTAAPTSATWIVVSASGSNGCADKDSILVHVGSIAGTVDATANPTVVVPGSASTLTASPSGYSYLWFPVDGLSSPTSQVTQATVDETTTYTVFITDGICTRSDKVELKVLSIACDERFVFVPNAFSPNADGENDVLYVRSAIATTIEFRVFDRWGEMIFESTSVNNGWDGTFRDKLVDPDVYDFYLKAICISGDEQIIKGNITLIR